MEPRGEERADLRAGIIASTIANANRDPKKTKPFKPGDFMPKFDNATEAQSEEEMRIAAQTLVIAFGGKMGKLSDL